MPFKSAGREQSVSGVQLDIDAFAFKTGTKRLGVLRLFFRVYTTSRGKVLNAVVKAFCSKNITVLLLINTHKRVKF